MNRPKIEITSIELDTFLGGSNPIAIYISQLNNYIDQLEKALDKACEELHVNKAWCHYGYMSKKCGLSKEEWKKELMKYVK